MPWKANTTMSLKREFVIKAQASDVNLSELCRLYGISRKTGYKWLQRFRTEGFDGLKEQSRQPRYSPNRTSSDVEHLIVAARHEHPAWGGRKLKRWLENQGHQGIPSPSTITAILRRHGLLDEDARAKRGAYQRFEMSTPNALWQMDFKGPVALTNGQHCHPLTILDDHSRFLVGLCACGDETHSTVQTHLTTLFRTYGLPARMLMDNGPPWGDPHTRAHTVLTAWLLRLGIQVSHGRPYHPQTQGKDERLHRTLHAELLSRHTFCDLAHSQQYFDPWRETYNLERPHEALDFATPITRYTPSPRLFPDPLPPIDYPASDYVRKVDRSGKISFRNRPCHVGKAFQGQPVGLRPDPFHDGHWHVFFCDFKVTTFDFRSS